MNKKRDLLEKHPYKIWKGRDGRWSTYLPDDTRECQRRLVKRIDRAALEDAICDYWREKIENPTVNEIFHEWITRKLQRGEICRSTMDRYSRQYDECFSEFGKKRIRTVTEYDVEDFMLTMLHEKNMTAKGFSNFRTLVFGIFKFAKKRKFINYSITEVVSDMDISRRSFRKNRKTDEEQVFMDDELPRILEYLDQNADMMNIGLFILFKSGLRIGELAGLKCEDIEENVIHVRRTEINYYNEDGERIFEVRDFPKTEAGIRDVVIPKKYEKYLKKVLGMSSGTYLFEQGGRRIRTYQFRSRLLTVCKKLNITVKSPHKIRKTYASILIDSGVSESVIISQMGHTDIQTTKNFYYRNRSGIARRGAIIDSVENL